MEPTPEPTPTEEPKEETVDNCAPGVTFVGPYCGWSPKPEEHQATAPVCPNKPPEKLGTNFHVYRKGSDAILKWWPGDGKNANIYYKQNGSDSWQYSVIGIENTGYYEIHDLDNLDITFALEEVNGCGGGVLIHAVVDGASDGWVLWR